MIVASGLPPARAADRLARLALGLARDRAGVDDDALGQPRSTRTGAHDLRLVGVEPAAHGDDLEPAHAGSTPVKLAAVGPVISTWPSSRQTIPNSPPSRTTVTSAPGEPAPRARDRRGAGARAAGLREADAALPHAEPADGRIGEALGDADIRALGEERIGLQAGADLGQWHGLGVVHEEHRVRVAHVDRDGVR